MKLNSKFREFEKHVKQLSLYKNNNNFFYTKYCVFLVELFYNFILRTLIIVFMRNKLILSNYEALRFGTNR